jgi:predicted methyltransferase
MRIRTALGALCALGLLIVNATAAAQAVPEAIRAAVADPTRPEADRARDPQRKPAEVLAFAGVKPGDRVGELLPGRGYFTGLFCRIVGSAGHVYTLNLKRTDQAMPPPGAGAPKAPPPAPAAPPCDNITADTKAAADFALPAGLDLVWTSENYHDLHNKMFGPADMLLVDKAVFNALKPGGVFIVEDHAAEAGSGARDTDTLHRIDPALVRKEVLAAGFVLDGESTLLHNPNDPHTEAVFKLEGTSDKFLLKFRRPLK